MGENKKISNYSMKHNNCVIFVEPNHFTKYNIEHNTDIETSMPLEDLTIYCDLEVEVFDRVSDQVTSFFRLENISNKDGENNIHLGYFMQGSNYGNVNSFTTNYTDMSYREALKNVTNTEMFGINSINVSYDAWLCPVVTMEFTDVRGISLFTAQELAHNITNANDGMTGLSSEDEKAISSFFSCFFKFPYPKFKLYLKGFYGDAIAYDLGINKFTSKFDSQTGNFNVHVEFVGFKFGALNDLTMTSLAACVSSSEGDVGGNYWEKQVQANRFMHNGEKLAKVGEIAAMYEEYENALKTVTEEITQEIQEKEEANNFDDNGVTDLLQNYIDAVQSLAEKITNANLSYYNSAVGTILNDANANSDNPCMKKTFQARQGNVLESYKTYYQSQYKKLFNVNVKDDEISWCSCDFAKVNYNNNETISAIYQLYEHITTVDKKPKGTIITGTPIANKNYTQNTCSSTLEKEKCYIRPFSGNSLFSTITTEFNETRNVLGKKYKSNIKFLENKYMNNTLAKDCGVTEAYQKIEEKVKELLASDSVTDTVKTQLNEFSEALTKCNVFTAVPKMLYLHDDIHLPIYVEYVSDKFPGTDLNRFAHIPISKYTINFSKIKKIFQKNEESKQDFSNEKKQRIIKAQEECIGKYLTFNTSLIYITKSLWAHVETFFDMCLKTRSNIISNKENRTVKSMNLNKENSNLPRAYYVKDNLFVPPFPMILDKQEVSGETHSHFRKVTGYLGDSEICPSAPEITMVDTLLHGAAQYWNIVHYSQDESQTETPNVYQDSTREIRIAVYYYLKRVFEKWIHSMKNSVITDWGVDEYFSKHFLFIDTFYARLDDSIGINAPKFAKACHEIFEHKDNTLMSFMISYMQEVNTILQPTQGFMLNDISNKNNIIDYYTKIFTPIPYNKMSNPDSTPYFVVIYRGLPSENLDYGDDCENENDGFMISNDDNIEEVPLGLKDRELDNGKNGYIIPAIGVSYGKQYQHYFMDVSVDMSNPSANETAIAAQYNLAGVSTSDNSSGNEQSIRLGQDLYTVYANNSYNCKIRMMGCMWIQPLMYFQLNNVPMFRGTYMIKQVTHSVTVGNMITEFEGVRMSKYSSPFVNKTIKSIGSQSQEQIQQQKESKASFDNNCPYHEYDVNGENAPCGGASNCLSTDFVKATFGSKFGKNVAQSGNYGIKKWYDLVKDKTVKFAFASILIGEAGWAKSANDSRILNYDLHALLFLNEISEKGINSTKKWLNCGRYCCLRSGEPNFENNVKKFINDNKSNTFAEKSVEKIFTQGGGVLVGKVMNGYGSNGKDERGTYSPHTITLDDMQRVYYTAKQKDSTLIGGHGDPQTKRGCTYYKSNKKIYWTPVKNSSGDSKSTKEEIGNFGERLLNCIKQTFDNNENSATTNYSSFFTEKIDEKSKTITFSLTDAKNSVQVGRLVDILLNVYYKYIAMITCSWSSGQSNIGVDDNPTNIVIQFNKTLQGATKIVFKHNNSNIIIKEGSFPNDMLKVLKKKYVSLTDKKASAYILNKFEEKST